MTVIHDTSSSQARTAQRNLDAQVRATEEGHVARISEDRQSFTVKAEGGTKSYTVRVYDLAGHVAFSCSCPAGRRQSPAGESGCKHAALVALRLERAGLAHFDGMVWRVTERAETLAGER